MRSKNIAFSFLLLATALVGCQGGGGRSEEEEDASAKHIPIKLTVFQTFPPMHQIYASESWSKKFGQDLKSELFYPCHDPHVNFEIPDYIMEKMYDALMEMGADRLPSRDRVDVLSFKEKVRKLTKRAIELQQTVADPREIARSIPREYPDDIVQAIVIETSSSRKIIVNKDIPPAQKEIFGKTLLAVVGFSRFYPPVLVKRGVVEDGGEIFKPAPPPPEKR